MTDTHRREFLRSTASTLGAAAVLAALPPALRAALAVPAARVTGTIQDVEHVVILMQENRSFDHYFGTLRGVRGFGDPRPIPIPGGNNVWHQPTTTNGTVLPFHLDTAKTGAQCLGDIDHNWKVTHSLWKDHAAWVKVKGPLCMGHFTRADLPFYYALADAFTVCDAYFCSVQGPTNPNRLHLFTGTAGLSVGVNGTQAVYNIDDGNWTADMSRDNAAFAAFTWNTYAGRLQTAGISWRVYQEYDNYGDNSLAYFAPFRNLNTSSQLYQRARAYSPGSNAGNAYTSTGDYLVADFAADVQAGTLPQVSWIVAPYLLSEHPEATPAYGESLAARLLAALGANPLVWAKTVFIINYDENGGFFDHIAPPLPPLNANWGLSTVPVTGENYNGVPVGLGIRVPMIVVSPWTKGGWVNSQVFDHTSIIRFLETRFGIAEPNISAWRRAVTGDLSTVFDFANPDLQWPSLPDTSDYIATADLSCELPNPGAPANASLPHQEPGLRRARALPYQLHVQGRSDPVSGRYWLDFVNEGSAGAALNVLARNRNDGPWYYLLQAGTQLSDYWSAVSVTAGVYDLHVHGPNGFLRSFQGSVSSSSGIARPELRLSYDLPNRSIHLHVENSGSAACSLLLQANHYSHEAPNAFVLAAGATIDLVWPVASRGNWYDLSLSWIEDAAYLRRVAGHLEDGQPSISDPAFGASADTIFQQGFEVTIAPPES